MRIKLNVTDAEGVLLGQVELDSNELEDSARCAESIGWQVLEQLPTDVPRCQACRERPVRGMSYRLCVECLPDNTHNV